MPDGFLILHLSAQEGGYGLHQLLIRLLGRFIRFIH